MSPIKNLELEESGATLRTIGYRSEEGTHEEDEDDACSVATKKPRVA